MASSAADRKALEDGESLDEIKVEAEKVFNLGRYAGYS